MYFETYKLIASFFFISRNRIAVYVLICPSVELYLEIDNLIFKYYKSNSLICSNILKICLQDIGVHIFLRIPLLNKILQVIIVLIIIWLVKL